MGNTSTPVNITLAERIKYARKAMKITQTDLAEMIGVSDQVIRNYELGHVGIPKASAIAIATVLKFDAGYFLDESITKIRPLCSGVEAYKEIARTCFGCAKRSIPIEKQFYDFGFNIDHSPLLDVFRQYTDVFMAFTPDNISDEDAWLDDLIEMNDFEEFWEKWYETTERSF